jgi:hypothetical protein
VSTTLSTPPSGDTPATETLEVAPAEAGATSRSRYPGLATLFTVAFAVGGFRAGLGRLTDNSFFWHLRTGHWILGHGFPHGDVYSFTASGQPWVVQSWLAEVLYAVVDTVWPGQGIRLLVAVTAATIAACTFRLALMLCADRARAAAMGGLAIAASFTLWSERPLLFGVLAFVALLWIVEVPTSRIGRHPLVAVPVVLWLWAQSHGTFALGLGYLALHLAGSAWDGRRPLAGTRERQLLLATLIGTAAVVANPYGFSLLWFPVHLLGRGEILKGVIEWRSPDFRQAHGIALAVFLVAFVGAVARGRVRPSRRDLVVALPFLLLALWARRNIAVAPLVMLPIAARAIRVPVPTPDTHARFHRLVVAALALLSLLWGVTSLAEPAFDLRGYPVDALEHMESADLYGRRLVTDDVWAGLIIKDVWPRQAVFVDDRFDMYPVTLMRDFIALDGGRDDSLAILDRHDIEVVLWPAESPLNAQLAASAAWHLEYQDEDAVIYTRV